MEKPAFGPKNSRKQGKASARTTAFVLSDCNTYGLRVTASHSSGSSPVTSVDCRLCLVFGREETVGSKRRLIRTTKQFGAPFRKENYKIHLSAAHPTKWATYQSLSSADKAAFFENRVPFVNTLHTHAQPSSSALIYKFDSAIVDVIIGDVLWHPKDVNGETRARALALLTPCGSLEYEARIPTPAQFNLVVKFVAIGISLKQATKAVVAAKEETLYQLLGFASELKTQQYVRIACAVNLQLLANILRKVWAFSFALDGSTCLGTSYVDMRVRFVWQGCLYNLHVLAAPFIGRHTGLAQYDLVEKVFDVLSPSWQQQMIGCTSDGARNMTGKVQGAISRLHQAGLAGFYRVWCLLHQADILLQRVYEELDDFEYWKILIDVIGHLRRQQLLISEMRATCPLVSKVRWLSMYDVTSFLSDRRVEVRTHYESSSSTQTSQYAPPTARWWLLNHVVCMVIGEIKIVITRLQGKMTLLSQQEAQIEELRGALMQMVQMERVNHETSVNTRDWIQRGRLCLRKTSIAEFIQNSHVFCMEQYDDVLSLADQEQVVDVIGAMMLHLVEGLGNIVAIRDRASEASDDSVPPVLPHELVVLPSREMSKMIIKQKARLMSSASWTEQRIDQISTEHKQLQAVYRNDNAVKASIDQCNSDMPFNAAWPMATVAGRYSALVEFIGGLASIFPNTSVVESDFSILKYEKDPYRASMTDFTLQSILHCKQLATITAIPT